MQSATTHRSRRKIFSGNYLGAIRTELASDLRHLGIAFQDDDFWVVQTDSDGTCASQWTLEGAPLLQVGWLRMDDASWLALDDSGDLFVAVWNGDTYQWALSKFSPDDRLLGQ